MRLIDADRLKDTLVIMANKRGGSLDILDISDVILKAPTVERSHIPYVDDRPIGGFHDD